MTQNATNHRTTRAEGVTRRRFLGVAVATAGAGLCGRVHGGAVSDRLVYDPTRPVSRVVEARSNHVVKGGAVHATLLREILQAAGIDGDRLVLESSGQKRETCT